MNAIKVETWVSGNGKDYVAEFLAIIPKKAREKLIWDFSFIEQYGVINAAKARILKKLKGFELFEVRDEYNKVAYRILGKFKNSKLILYHGFVKKKQETPSKEINLALNRAKEDY